MMKSHLRSGLEIFSTLTRIIVNQSVGSNDPKTLNVLFQMDDVGVALFSSLGTLNRRNYNFLKYLNLGKEVLFPIFQLKELGYSLDKTRPQVKKIQSGDGQVHSLAAIIHSYSENSKIVFTLRIENEAEARRSLELANAYLETMIESTYQKLNQQEIASESLRHSQDFLDSIIENIPNMIFVKEAKSLRFLRLNRAGEELIGLKVGDAIGKTDYDFFPKEEAEFFVQKDREVLDGKAKVEILEEPIQTTSGKRFLHTTKIPILDTRGEPLYLLGISEDITEKKQMEFHRMELVRAQASRDEAEKTLLRLRRLAEASDALNESLDIQSMLASFAQIVTHDMYTVCIVDLYDRQSGVIDRTIAQADGSQVETLKIPINILDSEPHKDVSISDVIYRAKYMRYDSVTWDEIADLVKFPRLQKYSKGSTGASLSVVPLTYHGFAFGALTLITDDTEEVDNLGLSFAQDLARRASFALQNARLYYRANEASRAKSSFLANISHEVRTPLGAILGFAELVEESTNLSDQQKHYISTIIKNGQQLLHIVDEILDLSKVESDKIKIERLPFSLNRLIEEVSTLFRVKAQDKGIDLKFEVAPEVPDILISDPARIRQILINLIGNAIKFTESGAVIVTASFALDGARSGEGKIFFEIRDSGVGISAEQATKLFQPFVQADDSTSRLFGGTGLGLFLSRRLAHLMGGNVTLVSSHPLLGSCFRVELRIEVAPSHSLPKESLIPEEPELDFSFIEHSESKKILVVDDSPDNQALIRGFLDGSPLRVDLAGNGLQAVQSALHNHYDMVLMDIQMPEMDGFQAVKTLREKGYDGIVVALTAHAMKGDRERCLDSGFDDYLCKPISRKSLTHCLSKNIH